MKSTTSKLFFITFVYSSTLFFTYANELSRARPLHILISMAIFLLILKIYKDHTRAKTVRRGYGLKRMQIEGNRISPTILYWLCIFYTLTSLILTAERFLNQLVTLWPFLYQYEFTNTMLLVSIILMIIISTTRGDSLNHRKSYAKFISWFFIVLAAAWLFNFHSTATFIPLSRDSATFTTEFFRVFEIIFITLGNWILVVMFIDDDVDGRKFDTVIKTTIFLSLLFLISYSLDYFFTFKRLYESGILMLTITGIQFIVYYMFLEEIISMGSYLKITRDFTKADKHYFMFALTLSAFLVAYFFQLTVATTLSVKETTLFFVYLLIAIYSIRGGIFKPFRTLLMLALFTYLVIENFTYREQHLVAAAICVVAFFILHFFIRLKEYKQEIVFRNTYHFTDLYGSTLMFTFINREKSKSNSLALDGPEYVFEYVVKKMNLKNYNVISNTTEFEESQDHLDKIIHSVYHIQFNSEIPTVFCPFSHSTFWDDQKNVLEYDFREEKGF